MKLRPVLAPFFWLSTDFFLHLNETLDSKEVGSEIEAKKGLELARSLVFVLFMTESH